MTAITPRRRVTPIPSRVDPEAGPHPYRNACADIGVVLEDDFDDKAFGEECPLSVETLAGTVEDLIAARDGLAAEVALLRPVALAARLLLAEVDGGVPVERLTSCDALAAGLAALVAEIDIMVELPDDAPRLERKLVRQVQLAEICERNKEMLMVLLRRQGYSLAAIQAVVQAAGSSMSRSGIRGVLVRHGVDTSTLPAESDG